MQNLYGKSDVGFCPGDAGFKYDHREMLRVARVVPDSDSGVDKCKAAYCFGDGYSRLEEHPFCATCLTEDAAAKAQSQ
jgi:hypothetical protein